MPEEIAFARRQSVVRRASLRPDAALGGAVVISLLLFVPPVLVGWKVGGIGGLSGFALAVAAGGVVSVLITLLVARAWLRVSSGDRMFADATLTGWIRRGRAERQLAVARESFEDPNVASIPLHVDRLVGYAKAVEARDARTHRHSSRVALRAASIGNHLGLTADELTRLKAAARLHDVGALREPAWAEPTDEERLALALAGAELVGFTGDRRLVAALKHQNENFDGSGLPDGLSGDAIPLMSRIIAVANAYDMVAREQGQAAALAQLNTDAGSKFDPKVVEAFAADSQASPMSALRGAAAGMLPRASQGAIDVLRGAASVAAAATVATTAVVASGVGIAPSPAHNNSVAANKKPSAAVAGTATTANRAPSTPSSKKVRRRSASDGRAKADATRPGGARAGNPTPAPHDSQPGSSQGGGEPKVGDKLPAVKTPSLNDVPAAAPDATGNLGGTINDTTDTTEQAVGGVLDTVDQTSKQVTGTVDNVVGGLTGTK
jgi:hypothetical protein